MIQVIRTGQPEVLNKKQAEWQSALHKALDAYQKDTSQYNRKKLDSAFSKYNHKQIKDSLKTMFSGKCAYCESQITHIGYGHIEHFRPKSKFPDLCFEWDNLMLGCEICNGKQYKGDKFPENKDGGPFVNPVEENPEDFFDFEFDPETGTANIIPQNLRADITEMILGLNRPELVKRRSSIVQLLVRIAIKADKGDVVFIEELKRRCNNDEEYAAFARALVKRFKIE
ncbi:MAG: retron system putative HNH endonuclease [Draconibacterium sp.]